MKDRFFGLLLLLMSCRVNVNVLQESPCRDQADCPANYYCKKVVDSCAGHSDLRHRSTCKRDCRLLGCECQSDEECGADYSCRHGKCELTRCSLYACGDDCTAYCNLCLCGNCGSSNDAAMTAQDMSVAPEVDLALPPVDAGTAADAGMPTDAGLPIDASHSIDSSVL